MIAKNRYVALSEFRFRLQRFMRFSEMAARDAGITSLQYLLLLHLRGMAGREWATIGELADRLQASHQGAVALVKRCVAGGLVRKRRSANDARRVEIHLTARGRARVERIAALHVDELARLGDALRAPAIAAPRTSRASRHPRPNDHA